MPCLENPRHEHFCQVIAKGLSQRDAYRQAYGKEGAYRGSCGAKLMQNPLILARVAELQEEGARETVLTLQAAHRFLYSIVMEKNGEVCENIPVTQGYRRKETSSDKHSETTVECKLRDKLRALELAMKLQGLLRKTPEKKPRDLPADYTGAILPRSLLDAIQEKRRIAVMAQYARSSDNSPVNPSSPAS